MEAWGVKNLGVELLVNIAPDDFSSSAIRPLFIDVETDGLERSSRIIGVGFTFDCRSYYYCQQIREVAPIIESSQLIGHNIKFDFKALLREGLNLKPSQIAGDTMLMSYCENPTKDTHGLKPLALELLGLSWPTYEDLTTSYDTVQTKPTKKFPTGQTKTIKHVKTLADLPLETVANYNAMDVLATSRLYEYFEPRASGWYRDVELPLLRLLIQMELNGMHVDVSYFKQLYEKYQIELQEILNQLQQQAKPYIDGFMQVPMHVLVNPAHLTARKAFSKGPFNPGSSQQKLALLNFMGLKLDSTDKKILAKHKTVPFIKTLLEYSEVAGVVNKFLKRLIQSDGKVSTTYNQVRSTKYSFDDDSMVGIRSGRLSSSADGSNTDLNLQQIPSRSDRGKVLRNGFIAPPGHVFFCVDYSMIELRLLAHYSQEPSFVKAFKDGIDLHQAVADELGVERSAAKQANFLVSYGGGPRRLADALNLPLTKARQFFDKYWEKYAAIQEWKASVIRGAYETQSIVTKNNRRIPITEIASPDYKIASRAERQAVNYLIQGSAAEVIKIAMLRCAAEGFMPVLTVHDELGFYLADDVNLMYSINRIKQLMQEAETFSVPLVVEAGHAKSWGEAKS